MMPLKFRTALTSALGLAGCANAIYVPNTAGLSASEAHQDRHPGGNFPMARSPFGLNRRSLPAPAQRHLMRALRAQPDEASPPGNLDAARLDRLGSIGCINEPGEKVTPQTLDLLALYTGENTAFAMQEAPPNILADFPKEITNIVSSRSSGALGASDTVIFPACSDARIVGDAPFLKKNGRVIISEGDQDNVIRKMALLQAIRPDLELYGHAPGQAVGQTTPMPTTPATPVVASYAVADILAGERALVVRPLGGSDADWLSKFSGVSIGQGAAIAASFNKEGAIDRAAFEEEFNTEPATVRRQLAQAAELHQRTLREWAGPIDDARLETDARDQLGRTVRVPGVLVDRETTREQIMTLGPTVVYGASGNIGKSMSKALSSNGVPVCCIVRKPTEDILGAFAEMTEPKPIVSVNVPESFQPDTAFLTSSAGWPKDANGKVIFDRSKLLGANVAILAPIFRDLSPQIARTIVISNPCSEMAYLGWLLRPDLADRMFAHAGTDVTRQRNRAPFPDDTFTVGPHSPAQVNVKLNRQGRLEIDSRIPTLGQRHQERSRDRNSVTVPTGTAAISEGISIATSKAQSLALPLTAGEAGALSAFMAQQNQAIDVSEGIAITLPRDEQRQIRWNMLTDAALQIPAFPEKFRQAIVAMEDGRNALLQSVVDTINAGRPAEAAIDRQWVLDHRGAALSDALEAAQQRQP